MSGWWHLVKYDPWTKEWSSLPGVYPNRISCFGAGAAYLQAHYERLSGGKPNALYGFLDSVYAVDPQGKKFQVWKEG